MKTDAFRRELKEGILETLLPLPWVMAIWEGGSAATGYLDEYSDLDLAVVVEDERVEETFEVLEKYIDNSLGITSRLRLPEPTWHGHSQCFYFTRRCPPLFYIDLVIEKLSSTERLNEPDRHGESQIWLNREGTLHPEPTSPDVLDSRTDSYLSSIEKSIPLLVTEIRKQIARGRHIDAFAQYHRFIAGRLAGLLNLKHRPAKYDFGIRYAERAYPDDVNERLEKILYIAGFDELEQALGEVLKWIDALLGELNSSQNQLLD